MELLVMKRLSLGFAVLAVLLVLPLLSQGQGLKGDFTPVGPVPPLKSAETVVAEEFLNFTCPHCNSFHDASKPVFTKYGKRLKLVRLPVLFQGQGDAPLRLFYVAQAEGKEDLIVDALFSAAFKYNANIYDPAVVNFIARTNGLSEAYSKNASAESITKKITDSVKRAGQFGVNSTPTLVVQGAMKMTPEGGMQAFVAGFDGVVGQLLK